MDVDLTEKICMELNTHDPDDTEFFEQYFTLQVLAVKEVAQVGKGGQKRHRVILSDSSYYLQAMFTTQLFESLDPGVVKNAIVSVKLSCSFVQEKRLLVVSDIKALAQKPDRIGTPVNLNKTDDTPMPDVKPNVSNLNKASGSSAAPPQKAASAQKSAAAQKSGQPSSANGNRNIHAIEGLSPYGNSWTIKARCTNKSDMRTWSNTRGDGKLFNVTLMDETGEIRGTAFNQVAEDLYPKFEEGKVYFVSKARVNLAKKMFSSVANDYELSFERQTEVEECLESSGLPQVKYNFVPLSGLEEIQKDATCDVIGVVKEAGALSDVTFKASNRTGKKRELTLVDQSNFSVRLTLWGKHAEQYQYEQETPVIAFKGVKVGDFGGRSLSMVSTSIMTVNPELSEAFTLRGWFDGEGSSASFTAHHSNYSGGGEGGGGGGFNRKEMKAISEVKNGDFGMGDRVDYFCSRATVMHMKPDKVAYPACASEGCSKKVTEVGDGWTCEKCSKTFERPNWRYIVTMAVADWTGQAWYNGFNDAGEAVFQMDANVLMEKKENNQDEYNSILHNATAQTFNFVCRAKSDSFNDSSRVKYGISRITKLDYKEECNVLLDLINSDWGSA